MKTPPSLKLAKLIPAASSIEELQPESKPIAASATTSLPANDFLSVKTAAAYLTVSKSFLDKLRVNGGGPEFVRLSGPQDFVSPARPRQLGTPAPL